MDSKRYSKLNIERLGIRKWRLNTHWKTPYGVIPEGSTSNGANIPRIMWWFDTPEGKLFEASIAHDFFYNNKIETKPKADLLFLNVAKDFGVGLIYRYTSYYLVRLFGKGKYK